MFCVIFTHKETTQTITTESTVGPMLYSVSPRKSPPLKLSEFFSFFSQTVRIFNRFLRTYYTFLCALVYKFLFNCLPTLTKLCHIKRDYLVGGTVVSQSAHQSTQWHSVTAVTGYSISPSAIQTNQYRKTILQLCSTCNLELSASCYH